MKYLKYFEGVLPITSDEELLYSGVGFYVANISKSISPEKMTKFFFERSSGWVNFNVIRGCANLIGFNSPASRLSLKQKRSAKNALKDENFRAIEYSYNDLSYLETMSYKIVVMNITFGRQPIWNVPDDYDPHSTLPGENIYDHVAIVNGETEFAIFAELYKTDIDKIFKTSRNLGEMVDRLFILRDKIESEIPLGIKKVRAAVKGTQFDL